MPHHKHYICDVYIYDIIDTGAKNGLHCKTVTIFIEGISNSHFPVITNLLAYIVCVGEVNICGASWNVSHNSSPDMSKISSYGLHPVTSLVQLNSPLSRINFQDNANRVSFELQLPHFSSATIFN